MMIMTLMVNIMAVVNSYSGVASDNNDQDDYYNLGICSS